MNEQARVALEVLRKEHPEWDISFTGGSQARWHAWRFFAAPAALVSVECSSARDLRGRLMANDWTVTPRDHLSA